MIELLLAVALLQEKVATDKGCIECHDKQHDDWKDSVHQKNAIGCVACHGADEVGSGDKPHAKNKETFVAGTKKTSHLACVKCHEGVVEAFKQSQHWRDMEEDEESKLNSCMSCHTHHATDLAEPGSIAEKSCSKCHRKTSVQWKMMQTHLSALSALQQKVDLLAPKIEHKVPGVAWKDEAGTLEDAQQLLKEAAIEQHKVERGKREGALRGFRGFEDTLPATAADVAKAYSSLDSRQKETGKRPLRLLGFLGLLAVTLLLARAWLVRWGHAA